MATEPGIDVAWPQGSFNWGPEKGKIAFGMAKATEGINIADPDFVHNWNSMWALTPTHTLPRFAYHFFRAAQDPIVQAEYFLNVILPHGLLAGDGVVLDLESTKTDGSNDGVAPAATALRARHFLEYIDRQAPGRRVLVYTNPAFAEAGNCAGMQSWALWVADYGVRAPAVPGPWSSWTFWQRSDSTGLDLDVFNGTGAQLAAFTGMPKSR